jgi:hypothetical protein
MRLPDRRAEGAVWISRWKSRLNIYNLQNIMLFDIDRELEDDTSDIEPCMGIILVGIFFAIVYQLVGNSMGSEL